MRQMWKINVKSISCIAEEVLTSVFDVDANGPDSIDHTERLSNFPKEALIGEVLKTWDALAEAEASIKDMVLEFKGTKKEYVARRVSRISANEIHVQLIDGKKEVAVNFGEIVQVALRHKDAK